MARELELKVELTRPMLPEFLARGFPEGEVSVRPPRGVLDEEELKNAIVLASNRIFTSTVLS